MSIFGSIASKIFGEQEQPAEAAPPAPQPDAAAPAAAPPADAGTAAPAAGPVDVEAVLTAMAAKAPEPLDWRSSIVDLMKLLGLDSSLAARRKLAQELHYDGDTEDSAAMNIWLQRQVMQQLAAHGGKVPAELRG